MSGPAVAPRVRLLDAAHAPLAAQPFYAGGDPGPIASSLAHLPDLLPQALAFLGAALGDAWMPLRTKEIVVLRVSALAGCRYCTAAHTVVALDSGLNRAQVQGLRGDGPLDTAFDDPADLALVSWCDAVHAGTEDDLASARRAVGRWFDDGAVVELTLCATTTLMLNRYATSLALPVSADTLARLAAEGFPA